MGQEFNDILRVEGIRAKGFGIIPKLVMMDKRLTIEAKAIYSYFCSYAGAGSVAFPGRNKIVEDLGISIKRYYKHFNLLKKYGYLEVEQITNPNGVFSHNVYKLVEKPDMSDMAEISPCSQNDYTEEPPCSHFAYTQNDHTNNNNLYKNNNNNNIYNNHSFIQDNIAKIEKTERRNDKFDEQFYNRLLEELKLEKHFDPESIVMIEQAIVHLLQGRSDVPVSVLKNHLIHLDNFAIERAINNFKRAKNVKSPLAYFAKCIYRSGVEQKAEIENFMGQMNQDCIENKDPPSKPRRSLNYLVE